MATLKHLITGFGILLGAALWAQPAPPSGSPPATPSEPPPSSPPTTPPPAPPTEPPPAVGARLVNISVRGSVAAGQGNASNTFGGFVIAGGNMRVLVHGAGPRLRPNPPTPLLNFNVPDFLSTPRLDVWQGNTATRTLIARNQAWGTQATTNITPAPSAATLQTIASAVSGFDFESGSADAGTLIDVAPGPYTMELSTAGTATGTGILGFWADTTQTGSTGSFSNISARGVVRPTPTGLLTAGTVVAGTGNARIVAVAFGPALTGFGVTGVLANPTLTVRRLADASVVASNTNWSTSSDAGTLNAALTRVGSGFQLASGSADSAVIVNVPAGGYTFEVSSANNTGIALVGLWLDTSAP